MLYSSLAFCTGIAMIRPCTPLHTYKYSNYHLRAHSSSLNVSNMNSHDNINHLVISTHKSHSEYCHH